MNLEEIDAPEDSVTDDPEAALEEATVEIQEATVRGRGGRVIGKVISAFDWDESAVHRIGAGNKGGGQFAKAAIAKRGAQRERIDVEKLTNEEVGQAVGKPAPGGAPTPVDEPMPSSVPPAVPSLYDQIKGGGMWSPPGGWTSTDEKDHPKYPKGFPKKGGSYIRVGDRFEIGSHEWEVAHIAKGHLILDEASGKKSKVKTTILKPEEVDQAMKNAKPAKVKTIIGNKSSSTVRIVDPYVDEDSHDPNLTKPPTSKLTDEQWKRFGRAEQLHYTDLMDRFGQWKTGAPISAMIQSVLNEFDSEIVTMVKDAHKSQYGSSTGGTISLSDYSGSEAKLEKRSKAMDMQGRLRDVIAWDLYNRTKSPDIALFHGSGDSLSWWKKLITTKQVFSGMSQSFDITPTNGFGANKLATPMSIRHIVFASIVTQWAYSGFKSEREIAIVSQFVADTKRSMIFSWNEIGAAAKKWLKNETKNPKAGPLLQKLRGHLEKGEPLPVTVDADINIASKDQKPPNPAALEALESEYGKILPEVGTKYQPKDLPKQLPWKHTEKDGTPIAMKGEEVGVKPGDFMMGMQGTLYWAGLGPSGLKIHKIVANSEGHLSYNGESFDYNASQVNYFLLGNVQPLKDETAPDFDKAAWQFAAEDKKAISTMEVGEKFKVDGVPYEKTGKSNVNTTPIKDLESGLQGTIASAFQAVRLVPAAGYSEKTKLQPAKGMTLSYEGKKAVVTSVKKDGTVSIKPYGQKVKTLAPDDASLDNLFNPEDWSIGEKTKIGNLVAGDMFQGGLGKQTLKPYLILGMDGKKIKWQDLDTGQKGSSLALKQVRQLVPDKGTPGAAEKKPTIPTAPDEPDAPSTDAEKLVAQIDAQEVNAEAVTVDNLPTGTVFTKGGAQYLKNKFGDVVFLTANGAEGNKTTEPNALQWIPYKVAPPEGWKIEAGGTLTKNGEVYGEPDKPSAPKIKTTVTKEMKPVKWTEVEAGDKVVGMDGKPHEVKSIYTVPQMGPAGVEPGGVDKVVVSYVDDNPTGTHVAGSHIAKEFTKTETVDQPAEKPWKVEHTTGQDISPADNPARSSVTGNLRNFKAMKDDKLVSLYYEMVNDHAPNGEPWQEADSEAYYAIVKTMKDKGLEEDLISIDQPDEMWEDDDEEVEVPDIESLPEADDFNPYTSPKGTGGKYNHDKIQDMPVGTVFQDKNKKLWKVQVNEATAVITDGEKNFQIDGDLRGRAMPEKTLGGPPPPVVPEPYSQPGHPAEAITEKPSLLPFQTNSDAISLNDMPVGSWVKLEPEDDVTYVITSQSASGTALISSDASPKQVSNGWVPAQWIKPATVKGPQGSAPPLYENSLTETDETLNKLMPKKGTLYYMFKGQHFAAIDGKRYVVLPDGSTENLLDEKWKQLWHGGNIIPDKIATAPYDLNDPPALSEPKPEPETSLGTPDLVQNMDAGDEFEVDGNPYQVIVPGSAGTYLKDMVSGHVVTIAKGTKTQEVPKAFAQLHPKPEGMKQKINMSLPPEIWSKVQGMSDDDIKNLPTSDMGYFGSPWGSGAKYKHWALDELKPGDVFIPKGSKNDYVLVKSVGGGVVLVYRPDTGAFELAEGTGKVKLKSDWDAYMESKQKG